MSHHAKRIFLMFRPIWKLHRSFTMNRNFGNFGKTADVSNLMQPSLQAVALNSFSLFLATLVQIELFAVFPQLTQSILFFLSYWKVQGDNLTETQKTQIPTAINQGKRRYCLSRASFDLFKTNEIYESSFFIPLLRRHSLGLALAVCVIDRLLFLLLVLVTPMLNYKLRPNHLF